MTLLTERERRRAMYLVEGGHSFNEVAEIILEQRNVPLARPLSQEIAALFGRRLYPIGREKNNGSNT